MTRISRIWITKPLTLSISPIESAPPVSTPCRWKNRTSRATRAAELGTASWMNWTAYCSIRTGANSRSRTDAPIVENACGIWETGARSSAVASHTMSADFNSSQRAWMPTFARAEMRP